MKIQNEGRTTVDKKPTTLILRNARPCMRAGSAPPVTLQSSTKDDGWASGTTAATAAATAPASQKVTKPDIDRWIWKGQVNIACPSIAN